MTVMYQLSILYLRCQRQDEPLARDVFEAFNSLFEMPVAEQTAVVCMYANLSILYLRCSARHPEPRAAASTAFQFSI